MVPAHIALELGLGHARLLEIELVEPFVRRSAASPSSAARPSADGTARSGRSRRGSGRAAAAPRARQPARPSRGRRSRPASRPAHRRGRPCRRRDAAGCIARWPRARSVSAVAAHVGRDGAEAGLGERAELMPPGVPGLGEAVAEDDERALAPLRHVHADAVGLDDRVLHARHWTLREWLPAYVPAAL